MRRTITIGVFNVRASVTALAVAMGFMRALTQHKHLFAEQELEFIKHFCLAGRQALPYGVGWGIMRSISLLPFSAQRSIFSRQVCPGYDNLILLRKLMIRNQIENSINQGTTQIIFLGGGCDTRALLSSFLYSHVNFYEIDRGPTREHKIKALSNLPKILKLNSLNTDMNVKQVNENLYYINYDLVRQNLLATLKSHGFQPEIKNTLIIAEGLTMYLNAEENNSLLREILLF